MNLSKNIRVQFLTWVFLSVFWTGLSLGQTDPISEDWSKVPKRVLSSEDHKWIKRSAIAGALAGGSVPLCFLNPDPQSVAGCLVVSSFLSLASAYSFSKYQTNSAEEQYDHDVKTMGVQKADSVYCKKYLTAFGATSVFSAIFAGTIYSALPK